MSHVHLAYLAAQHPRGARLRRRQDRRARPVRPSRKAEMWYRGELIRIVDLLEKAGRDIAAGLRSSWPATHDSVAPGLDGLLHNVASRCGNIRAVAERLANIAARLNLGEVDERLARAIRASVGVDVSAVLTPHGRITAALREATKANVELITSIPAQYLEQVREAVNEAFTGGLRWEMLVERIEHAGEVTRARAKFIAFDQTSKLNAAFNRVRQTGLGIREYIWSTSRDKRVRPEHRDLEGRRCQWDAPPVIHGEPLNPGEDYGCRCDAIPVINLDEIYLGGGGYEEREAA